MTLFRGTRKIYQATALASALMTGPSSDGAELLFHNSSGGFSELWLALPGAPARVLPVGVAAFDAAASIDGRIAFMRPDGAGDLALWVREPAGEVVRRLSPRGVDDRMPAFSPDGRRLAFVRGDARGGSAIWIASLDGSWARPLTEDAPPAIVLSPSWSPDGSRLAFASNQGGRFRIWTVRANGTEAHPLSDPIGADLEPSWSPDGRKLVFVRQSADGRADLVIRDLAAGTEKALVLAGTESGPVWSPRGDRIAFASDLDGDLEIYTARPDGSGLEGITHNDIDDTDPVWLSRPAGNR